MTTGSPIRIGTRGSELALAQARMVAGAFERDGRATKTIVVETEGDRRAPDTAWGEGAFVAAIERALLADRVDVAVHSAKDVPTDEDARLRIAAYLPRAEPLDALVARDPAVHSLDDLPPGSRVGTDSPRRTGFVLARRPDLHVHPLHGNVDTRLRRLDEGETDALVLAVAGLARLGRDDRISARIAPEVVPPAAGQGAIAVQVRANDARMLALAAAIDEPAVREAVQVERAFLRRSGGGCRAPIGALAVVDGERLELLAGYAAPDGSSSAIERVSGGRDQGEALVERLATRLAAAVPAVARGETAQPRPQVLVTRAAGQDEPLATALEALGVQAVAVPAIEILPGEAEGLDRAVRARHQIAWLVVTSANGARAVLAAFRRAGADPASVLWAAVGEATAEVLRRAGTTDTWIPSSPDAATIGAELPVAEGDRVLLARGSLADPTLAERLRERGAIVDEVIAYRTVEGPAGSRALLERVFAAGNAPAAVVFASGSAVRGLLAIAGSDLADRCRAIPAVCIGPATTAQARANGWRVLGEPSVRTADGLARLTVRLLDQPAGAPR